MASAGGSFLAEPEVQQALNEFFGEGFAKIEAGGDPEDMPDVKGHLKVRGIEAPTELRLELHHAVDESVDLEADVQPLAPICDEKGTRGYTVCERIKGKTHCYWVCPKVG